MSVRVTVFSLSVLAATPVHASFDDDGILHVSSAGTANNVIGRAIALRADGGFHAAGISCIRGVSNTPTLELRCRANCFSDGFEPSTP